MAYVLKRLIFFSWQKINAELSLDGVLCLRLHLICRGRLHVTKAVSTCVHYNQIKYNLKVLDFWRDETTALSYPIRHYPDPPMQYTVKY